MFVTTRTRSGVERSDISDAIYRAGLSFVPVIPRRESRFEIVHLAHSSMPQDTRVKREASAAALTGRRVAVIVLEARGEPTVERAGPVTIIRVPGNRTRRGPLSYLTEYTEFMLRCRWLLAQHQAFRHVRVVHVHTLPDFLIWAARPVQKRGGHVILDLHEIFPEFTRIKYPGALGRVAARLAQAIERRARRLADVTITVNTPIETLLAARPIGRAERLLVVHNSVDPQDFGPQREPCPERRGTALELVYHGTLTQLYGLDVAVRAVHAALGNGLDVRLAILGDGPERGRLEALAQALGLGDRVRFEGRLLQRDLPARLTRADAAVVPTRLNEMTRYSLSNKLLEYVHLGVPVVASRLPSYVEYLGDDAAWYWTPGDPADCARAIAALAAASPEERATRARHGQERLSEIEWTGERDRLVALYQELLDSR